MSPAPHKNIRVALVGNPNTGKSSLFNAITGLHQKTGNYAGVTVEKYEGESVFLLNEDQPAYKLSIIDLPGIYSLSPKTIDEQVACSVLLNERENIDVAVVVADASNLKRGLLIATQVIDLKYKTVLALNMIDEAEKQDIKIDVKGLSETLGVKVIAVSSKERTGMNELREAIVNANGSSSFFYDISAPLPKSSYSETVKEQVSLGAKADNHFSNKDQLYRFNTINYLVARFVAGPDKLRMRDRSSRIDKIMTHKVLGYLALLFVLFLVFQFIFFLAEYPMSWIEAGFVQLRNFISNLLPGGMLNDLLVNGVIAGISGVVMFIPQIALLFLFIGLLEDSGYMARASFIMDKLMRKFGLNGKSVIPLISGTACAVPSIMATRSISNVKERLITVFILPLISCSARLPVYTLIISLLFPSEQILGVFNVKGLVLMGMYILGFAFTLATAFVLHKLIKSKEPSFFVMELPVYRLPQARNIGIMVYNKVKVFILDAGKIILAISIVLWFLSANGPGGEFAELKEKIARTELQNQNSAELPRLRAQQLQASWVGLLGKGIEPAIKPLGFDWKIGISLITSFAAREVFVGTMATIYGTQEQNTGIREKLLSERNSEGKPVFTTASCAALLLFYAFALQCMSTIATVKRETKSWKWPLLQLVFMTSLAYLSALAAFQLLSP